MWPALLVASTMAVFALPLVPALREWRRRSDVAPLGIAPTHDGNVRHFAESFRKSLEGGRAAVASFAPTAEGNAPSALVDPGGPALDGGAFRPTPAESLSRTTSRLILSDTPLSLPDRFIYLAEVYGRQDVCGGAASRFQSVLAGRNLSLGRGSCVARWAHASSVYVAPDCEILGRLTAERIIVLSPRCSFRRVNAPFIQFGLSLDPGAAPRAPAQETAPADPRRVRRIVLGGDFELSRSAQVRGDLVVRGKALIRSDAEIAGSLKAHGAIALEPRAKVHRSAVSRADVIVGDHCAVGGPIVSEGAIEIGANSIVGSPAAPTTVTAPVIRVRSGAVVHGTLWARGSGEALKVTT